MSKKTTAAGKPAGIMTAEQEKELTKQLKALQPRYHNAPKTLTQARERIMELELVLGDLHRAAEIATVVRDFGVVESFLKPAEDALAKKITTEYPSTGPMKITVVTGELDKKHVETQ
jgi:hypothetical protein